MQPEVRALSWLLVQWFLRQEQQPSWQEQQPSW